MRRHLVTFFAFSVIILIFSSPSIAIEETVSDFTLPDINGKNIHLSQFLGKKVILINFWATWCIPCQQEFPHLEKIHKKYASQDFILLAISADKASTMSRIKPFIKRHRYSFTVLVDRDSQVVNRFNPKVVLPFTVVIGKDKKIKYQHEGYKPGDETEMDELISKLLQPGS